MSEQSIVFTYADRPSDLDSRGVPWHGALSREGLEGFKGFGAELLRITSERIPQSIHSARLPSFKEGAAVMLQSAGLDTLQVPLTVTGFEMHGRDPIEERDAVYEAMKSGEGVQLFLVLPEVARVMLCGNTSMTSEEAETVVCSGVVGMGFDILRRTRTTDGFRGKVQHNSDVSIRMTTYGTDPNEFSLSS